MTMSSRLPSTLKSGNMNMMTYDDIKPHKSQDKNCQYPGTGDYEINQLTQVEFN